MTVFVLVVVDRQGCARTTVQEARLDARLEVVELLLQVRPPRIRLSRTQRVDDILGRSKQRRIKAARTIAARPQGIDRRVRCELVVDRDTRREALEGIRELVRSHAGQQSASCPDIRDLLHTVPLIASFARECQILQHVEVDAPKHRRGEQTALGDGGCQGRDAHVNTVHRAAGRCGIQIAKAQSSAQALLLRRGDADFFAPVARETLQEAHIGEVGLIGVGDRAGGRAVEEVRLIAIADVGRIDHGRILVTVISRDRTERPAALQLIVDAEISLERAALKAEVIQETRIEDLPDRRRRVIDCILERRREGAVLRDQACRQLVDGRQLAAIVTAG